MDDGEQIDNVVGILKSEEEVVYDRELMIKGTKYHETRKVTYITDAVGKTFQKIKITRRIGDNGMNTTSIDVFNDDINVYHQNKTTLNDQNESDQFNLDWEQNWTIPTQLGNQEKNELK
jgi:hypothetical protein